MDKLVNKYAKKLAQAGLAEETGPLSPIVGGLDDTLVWNRTGPETDILEQVFKGLNINSLVFLRPGPPYNKIVDFLARQALLDNDLIEPKDCETRTFLHDLPVVGKFSADKIIQALKKKKVCHRYSTGRCDRFPRDSDYCPWNRQPGTGICGNKFGVLCLFC
jgi:hypothetical protein